MRDLTGEHLDLPEIADIIGRGTLQDWIGLRDALRQEPELKPKILAVCADHRRMDDVDVPGDFVFWDAYCRQRP